MRRISPREQYELDAIGLADFELDWDEEDDWDPLGGCDGIPIELPPIEEIIAGERHRLASLLEGERHHLANLVTRDEWNEAHARAVLAGSADGSADRARRIVRSADRHRRRIANLGDRLRSL